MNHVAAAQKRLLDGYNTGVKRRDATNDDGEFGVVDPTASIQRAGAAARAGMLRSINKTADGKIAMAVFDLV